MGDKKLAFIAHEFGYFPGHGGIASYLYNISSFLLKMPNVEIFIIAPVLEIDDSLKSHPHFHAIKISGSVHDQRKAVLDTLKRINPDYVEIADYLALGLFAVMEKQNNQLFKDSTFVVNSHTATRECWEWTNLEPLSNAPDYLYNTYLEEKEQLTLAAFCIAPSSFLANYIRDKYELNKDIIVFANPYINNIRTKKQIISDVKQYFDIEKYFDTFNIVLISRFERRKSQERLLEAFSRLKADGLGIKLFLIGNSCEDQRGIDYREYLIRKYLELPDCYFYDFLNLEEQEKFIAIADLSVLPSTYENQPVAMIETCLRGIPVMASIHSGIADYTPDDDLLFNPFKEDDLYQKIRSFYCLPQSEKNTLWNRQYSALKKFIDPEKCIIDRINLGKKCN